MRDKIDLLKVISEMNRVRILMMLMQKSLCVCEITSILKLSTATVSSHLSYLRRNNLIDDQKNGKWISYSIVDKPNDPMANQILELLPVWFENEPSIIEDRNKVKTLDKIIFKN